MGRYLPAVLSVEEVEAIMDSVDLSSWTGKRDRAILEVLYGCGLPRLRGRWFKNILHLP